MTIKDLLKEIDFSDKKLKQFGFLFSAISSIALIYQALRYHVFSPFWLIMLVFFLFGALFKSQILKPVYSLWMLFAAVMNRVMSTVILAIVFYCLVTPMALVMRLCGSKFMDVNLDGQADSYWEQKEKNEKSEDYSRQF